MDRLLKQLIDRRVKITASSGNYDSIVVSVKDGVVEIRGWVLNSQMFLATKDITSVIPQ